MNPEVKFKQEKNNYYNRAVGIIKKDNKFLVMQVDDTEYYHIPGGHIELGEDSFSAIIREIKEELDYTVKTAKLFCIQENFYEKKGISQHGIEFYYIVEIEEDIETIDRKIIEIDRGEEKHLNTRWVNISELKKIDLRPYTVKELLVSNKLNSLTHIIKRD